MVNSSRKPSIWSRKRIEQLIELYYEQDCLWNPYSEHYKNKGKRSKSIESICNVLDISKPEFAKKIHNLRNQFNTEFKKYERRLEEAEEDENGAENGKYRCRWVHFESLMFLKDVIAPRPSFQSSQVKKSRINCDEDPLRKFKRKSSIELTDGDDVTEYHIEASSANEDDFQDFDQEHNGVENFKHSSDVNNGIAKSETNDVVSLAAANTGTTKYFTQVSPATLRIPAQDVTGVTKKLPTGAVIELTNANVISDKKGATPLRESIHNSSMELRDQWSAFGEFIANEMRNFNSDVSRRKLKRKIMQAMLEVGEQDDVLAPSAANSN